MRPTLLRLDIGFRTNVGNRTDPLGRKNLYLPICSNGASTVGEEFGHVVVADKLPQAGL